ncbi:MAG: DUF4238 domain-containing protein [Paracoccaceae bacterium]
MPLDHYVSKVHLKQFLGNSGTLLLNAIRKSDGKIFTPRTKDICRELDGNTNPYLAYDRAVEEFLKSIEPAYEPCLSRVSKDELDWQSRKVFAGFLAYIGIYTPAALRMSDTPTRAMLEREVEILEKQGMFSDLEPPALPEFQSKAPSQLLKEGLIKFEIDPKHQQALATLGLMEITEKLANCDVTIVVPRGNGRFLTSDFPSVILEYVENKYAQQFLPLSPKIGLVFHTHTFEAAGDPRHQVYKIGSKMVQKINNEIIKAAEDLVFSSRNHQWLRSVVNEFKDFRTELVVQKFGPYQFTQKRVMKVR